MRNPTKDNRAIVAQKYRENTNVFAYYVMTCALQNSPDVFLVWCYKNNPTTAVKPRANLLQFRTIPANFNGFMEMLHHCNLKPIMLTQPHAHGNNQDLLHVDVLGSTMRMTSK
jgi:hypothetical protein